MVRVGEYHRGRRLTMQLVMWGLLAAALGIAALIDVHRGVKLLPAAQYGPIVCELPVGWQHVTLIDADRRLAVCIVQQEQNPRDLSVIWIYCDEAKAGESALEYFKRSQWPVAWGRHFEMSPDAGWIDSTQALRLVQSIEVATPQGETVELTPLMVLCAVLPNRLAVTIAMKHDSGVVNDADISLMDAVAESIKEAAGGK